MAVTPQGVVESLPHATLGSSLEAERDGISPGQLATSAKRSRVAGSPLTSSVGHH